MMEKKHTDEKNYLSVRIKWCALLAAGLVGAFLVRMWVVCIREMQSLMVPAVFTSLSAALAVIVYRTVLIPYRETRKIYEQLSWAMSWRTFLRSAIRFHRRVSRQSCA